MCKRKCSTCRGVAGLGVQGSGAPPPARTGSLVRFTQIHGDFWRKGVGVRDRVRTLGVSEYSYGICILERHYIHDWCQCVTAVCADEVTINSVPIRPSRDSRSRSREQRVLVGESEWLQNYWELIWPTGQLLTSVSPAGWTSSRYDTIRDAILTCARKPTWNCKTEKLKSKNSLTVKSLGESCSQSWRRKRKTAVGRICRKRF